MKSSYTHILEFLKSRKIANVQIAALLIEQELKKNSLGRTNEQEILIDALFDKLIQVLKDKELKRTKIVFEILSVEAIEGCIQQDFEKYQRLKKAILEIGSKESLDFDLALLLGEQLLSMLHWFPNDGDLYHNILAFSQFSVLRVSPFLFYKYLEIDIDRAIKNGIVTGDYCERLTIYLHFYPFESCCRFILDCFDKLIEHIQKTRPELYEMSIDDLHQEKVRQLMKLMGSAMNEIEVKFLAVEEKTTEAYAVFDRAKKFESACRKELFTWVF
jgi:hypothetical protein